MGNKGHLYNYESHLSFEELKQPTNKFTQPPLSIKENLSVNNCIGRGQIFLLYNILVKNHKDSTEHKINRWINDLQVDISDGEWSEICSGSPDNKYQSQTDSV